jgi:hypothetical protein
VGEQGLNFTYISDGSEDLRITGVQVQQMKRKIKRQSIFFKLDSSSSCRLPMIVPRVKLMMEAPNLPNITVGQRTDLLLSLAEASPMHRFNCNCSEIFRFPSGQGG